MRERHVEGAEVPRDAPGERMAAVLKASDLLLTLGGDGTFLAGARLAAPRGIPILGVNHGRLGFLTEIEAHEMSDGLSRYLNGDYRIEERTMLQVTLVHDGTSVHDWNGLNEVAADPSEEARILRLEVDAAGQAGGALGAAGAIGTTRCG